VFPQFKNAQISEFSDSTSYEIETTIMKLIESNKYTTEKEIINTTYLHFAHLRQEFEYKQTQIKRILPEIYEKYNLKRVKTDKQIKEQYGVKESGYPFIIIKNNN
jgi:hypothetical protein